MNSCIWRFHAKNPGTALGSGATLPAHGKTTISTPSDAAEVLRALAADGAYWLLRLGLIRAGMLGVPVLAGFYAYTIAEAAGCIGSREVDPPLAHGLYAVIAMAMALGLGLGGGVLLSC